MGHLFDADTEAERGIDGAYVTTLTDRWNSLHGTPNGGYALAVGLRALSREMPFPDPLAVSAHFLRPAAVGAAEVRAEPLRVGRRLGTGQASLVQGGKEIVRTVATFTTLQQAAGPTYLRHGPPALPPPEDAVDPLGSLPLTGISVVDRVEYRVARIPGWVRGEPGGDPSQECWIRFSDGREPDLLSLAFLVDAMAPAVLDLGVTASTTVELTVHLRRRPAPGWLACRVGTRFVAGGYHEEDVEIWDSAGHLVAQSRQLALLTE